MYGLRSPPIALTASYIARCRIANVIGVRNGAIALAVAALEAVMLHSVIGSIPAAAGARVPSDRHSSAAHVTTFIVRFMATLSCDRTRERRPPEVRKSD